MNIITVEYVVEWQDHINIVIILINCEVDEF